MHSVVASVAQLFDTSDFPARWNCGNWTPLHGWSHILADLAIAGAYAMIPLALAGYWWIKRSEMAFPRLFWLFAAFIFSCGSTHVVETILFYHPVYRFSALLKWLTAVASWATVFAMFRIAPEALKLPGLSRANSDLNDQLNVTRRAEEALAKSNEALESFTGLVTHDLRNPLSSAMFTIELASEAIENGEIRLATDQLHRARESLRQMEALVRELHAESVLRSSTTQMATVSLMSVVEAASVNLAPLIASSGAQIIAGNLPAVHGSRTMMIQLFINLFENSIKYRGDEAPVINVSVAIEEGQEVIRVADNGVGIPAHELERIFNTGVRGERSTLRPGSGLGLAFCLRIMEAHGGTIRAVTPEREGAAFHLEFGRRQQADV